MGSFRVGRKFASHAYPEPHRGGGGPAPLLARVFATTEEDTSTPVPTGDPVLIPWDGIGDEIPVTPLSTGVLEVSGVVVLENESETDTYIITVFVLIDGNPMDPPTSSQMSIPPESTISIPYLAQSEALTPDTPVDVSVAVISDTDPEGDVDIVSATVAIQEVAA